MERRGGVEAQELALDDALDVSEPLEPVVHLARASSGCVSSPAEVGGALALLRREGAFSRLALAPPARRGQCCGSCRFDRGSFVVW